MFSLLLFYLIRSALLFVFCKLFSIIKINSIISCFSAQFNLFHGALPILFSSSLIGKYYILSTLSYTNYLYKIPGLINTLSYISLQNNNYRFIKKTIIISLFVAITFYFTFIFNNTILYTLPWLFCIFYMIFKIQTSLSLFDIVFISTWLAHAVGTLIYGLLNGFLTHQSYISLLPIAIIERSLFVIIAILTFHAIVFFDLKLKKILETIFKTKFTISL